MLNNYFSNYYQPNTTGSTSSETFLLLISSQSNSFENSLFSNQGFGNFGSSPFQQQNQLGNSLFQSQGFGNLGCSPFQQQNQFSNPFSQFQGFGNMSNFGCSPFQQQNQYGNSQYSSSSNMFSNILQSLLGSFGSTNYQQYQAPQSQSYNQDYNQYQKHPNKHHNQCQSPITYSCPTYQKDLAAESNYNNWHTNVSPKIAETPSPVCHLPKQPVYKWPKPSETSAPVSDLPKHPVCTWPKPTETSAPVSDSPKHPVCHLPKPAESYAPTSHIGDDCMTLSTNKDWGTCVSPKATDSSTTNIYNNIININIIKIFIFIMLFPYRIIFMSFFIKK